MSTDFQAILAGWGLAHAQVRPADGGYNNLSYEVAANGERYLLRVYRNTNDFHRIDREHQLLLALQTRGLSFSVPAPVLTGSGASQIKDGSQSAALFKWIPGETVVEGNISHAALGGRALGELQQALACVSDWRGIVPQWGDFANYSPHVPDPLAVPDLIGLDANLGSKVRSLIAQVWEAAPGWYESLPQQVLHNDFARGNVLMDGDRCSGVLDFEFAGYDLRLCDYGAALYMFGGSVWGTPEGWKLIEAFARGFLSRIRLTDQEIEALPQVMLLPRIGSLVHWAGRLAGGLAEQSALRHRAERLVWFGEWLAEHGEQLRGAHAQWQREELGV